MNLDELQHTVKCYYGEGFDACRYLERFFDYRIPLPSASKGRYYQVIVLGNEASVYEDVCKRVIDLFGFELREIEKYYRMTKIISYKFEQEDGHFAISSENALKFSLHIVVPIAIGLSMTNLDLFTEFIEGKNSDPLIAVLGKGDIAKSFCFALYDDFGAHRIDLPKEVALEPLEDKLDKAYKALFVENGRTDKEETHIGRYAFSRQTKEAVMWAISLLPEYAHYD